MLIVKREIIGVISARVEFSRSRHRTSDSYDLFAAGTTGHLIEAELGISVVKLQSDPLCGDQQIGARIADGLIDFLIFFWDPLEPQPHDPDVKALLRFQLSGTRRWLATDRRRIS